MHTHSRLATCMIVFVMFIRVMLITIISCVFIMLTSCRSASRRLSAKNNNT